MTSALHTTGEVLDPVVSSASSSTSAARVAALVKAHLSFVWRVLRRRGLSPAEADDAAQQVFLVLNRKVDAVAEGAEKAFLFRTAQLVAHDVHRARRRAQHHTDGGADPDAVPSSGATPEDLADRSQARAVLDMLLSKLSEERRTVFVLYELEQMELAEIAEVMETPVGTVASRLTRARDDFQKELERYKARTNAGRTEKGGAR